MCSYQDKCEISVIPFMTADLLYKMISDMTEYIRGTADTDRKALVYSGVRFSISLCTRNTLL